MRKVDPSVVRASVADYLGTVKSDLFARRLDSDRAYVELAALVIEKGEAIAPHSRGRVAAMLRRLASGRIPARSHGRRQPLRDVQIVAAVSLASVEGASLSRGPSSAFSIVAHVLGDLGLNMTAENVEKLWEKHDFKAMPRA